MDIIKIGKDSIKISLCTEEAQIYGFGKEQSNDNMKSSFLRLLIDTKEYLNYKVLEEKIVGEIFSGKDGGCEIFVSRVEAQDIVYKEKTQDEVIKKPRSISSVFLVENLDKLLLIVKRLSKIKYVGLSSVYYDDVKEKYYIILEDVSIKELKFAFLTEYATLLKNNTIIHIKEHYRCICKKDGVKILSLC